MKQVEAIIYGDLSQFWLQLGGATLCMIYAFGCYSTSLSSWSTQSCRCECRLKLNLKVSNIPRVQASTAYPEDALAEAK